MLRYGDTFPDFHLTAVTGVNHEKDFHDVDLDTYAGKWKVFFFWPKDFTFVCPTEISGFGALEKEFSTRGTQLIGASTDSDFVHMAWRQHHSDLTESPFPWLADIKKELSHALGIVNEELGVANRATFIVDPDNKIRFSEMTDLSVGRNPHETLRILDALQSEKLTPCGWKKGEAALN
ncbi:MAG: peroxiredoxin [Gammaproteobacteria bacterium]|nr:peroxiredoxin [Gammaproteobacteria bacterium]